MTRRRDHKPAVVQAAPDGAPGAARLMWVLLGVVVAISSGVVWAAFNPAPHTGGDNAGYITLAYSLLKNGTYTELFDPALPPHTKYPPVFPAILAALMAMGARTWTSLKAVALVSTVGTAALTFAWAQRRVGAAWGAGVAVVLALSSAVVYYSHWILSDPTFVLFTVLALWALERADEEGAPSGWLVLGVAAAGLAYFTRSAGLPLMVALLAWLALRRRWRALGASATAVGIPALLWMLRARGPGTADYSAEFWLVDPYQPGLGRVGVMGLLGRAVANLQAYVTVYLPSGIVGGRGTAVAVLGVALVGMALVGWLRRGRTRLGPAELFLPLYGGLILLWPEVWSGDRFALPLYPVLLIYAASALKDVLEPRGRALTAGAGVLVFLGVALPATKAWSGAVLDARACAAATRVAGPFACYGPRVGNFVEAAEWAGANLPPGSSVLSRKPRIFYVLSGLPSRTFPFDESPEAHLTLAASLGTRYELMDQWDGQAGRFVLGAVEGGPGAYCSVRGFGDGGGTQLLGILPVEARVPQGRASDGSLRVALCPSDYVLGAPSRPYAPSSSTIPLLNGIDG